jgi:hypothetical protein
MKSNAPRALFDPGWPLGEPALAIAAIISLFNRQAPCRPSPGARGPPAREQEGAAGRQLAFGLLIGEIGRFRLIGDGFLPNCLPRSRR